MQHLISFLHISIPVNSMRTFPCMYPNIFFNISCTGLDLYLIQTIRPLKVHLCDSIQTGLYLAICITTCYIWRDTSHVY